MSTQTAETAGQSEGQGLKHYLRNHMREYGLLFALIAIMVFFQAVTGGTLMRPSCPIMWACGGTSRPPARRRTALSSPRRITPTASCLSSCTLCSCRSPRGTHGLSLNLFMFEFVRGP